MKYDFEEKCLEMYLPLRPSLRSGTDSFCLCCPRTRSSLITRSSLGDRTFTVTAADETPHTYKITLLKSALHAHLTFVNICKYMK